jgi:hypothetical protein
MGAPDTALGLPSTYRHGAIVEIATLLFIAHVQQLVAGKGSKPEQTSPEQGQRGSGLNQALTGQWETHLPCSIFMDMCPISMEAGRHRAAAESQWDLMTLGEHLDDVTLESALKGVFSAVLRQMSSKWKKLDSRIIHFHFRR